jgi:hypothetical protein
MDLRETGSEVMDLAQGRIQWKASVSAILNTRRLLSQY